MYDNQVLAPFWLLFLLLASQCANRHLLFLPSNHAITNFRARKPWHMSRGIVTERNLRLSGSIKWQESGCQKKAYVKSILWLLASGVDVVYSDGPQGCHDFYRRTFRWCWLRRMEPYASRAILHFESKRQTNCLLGCKTYVYPARNLTLLIALFQ